MLRQKLSFMFLMIFMAFAATGTAGEPKAEDFSSGLIDRQAVIKNAASVDQRKYPNADTVLLNRHTWIKYKEDGTYVEWVDSYNKILTEKGKRSWNTISSWFNTSYNTTEFKAVEIIKPDGKIVQIDFKALGKEMIDRSQMGSNIYNPNQKILSVSVPGLEIGDVIHYIMYDNFFHPRVSNTFSDYVSFESTVPIEKAVYEITGPKNLPLKSIALKGKIGDTVKSTQSETDDSIHYIWVGEKIARAFPEPQMPPLFNQSQRLLVSTIPDWKWVSNWYWNLSKSHFETTTEMKQTVTELIAGVEDRQQKIEAIYKWVSQKVRYMGLTIEKEAPGYEPHDVKLTFEQRHGVCRDKAALLVAMLRLAGFEAFPVLIHNGAKKDDEVPAPFFNHAITGVREPDGSYQLMDSTDENAKRIFPAYLCDKSYLVATPEGETLKTSPIIPATENLMRIKTTGKIDAAGNLQAESVLEFDGINDNIYRGHFSRRKPEEFRMYFEGRIKAAAPGAQLTSYRAEPEDLMDTSKPLRVSISFEAKDILVSGGGVAMIPLPSLGNGIGMINWSLGSTGLEKRRYPLQVSTACGVRETVEIELDPSLKEIVSIPECQPIDEAGVVYRKTFAFNPIKDGAAPKLSETHEFMLTAVEYSPEEYLSLKRNLKLIEHDSRKMPIVRAEPAAMQPAKKEAVVSEQKMEVNSGDVEIMDVKIEYTLTDARNWSERQYVKKKVITYSGKKSSGEVKINFNPAWESVKLENAVVTGPDGKTQEISEQEINLMDQGWAGSAPRYPAGKTLVASLPAVDIGSVIEYTVVREHRNQPPFSVQQSFRSTDPLTRKSVTLRAPAGVIGGVRSDDTGVIKEVKLENMQEYTWTAENQPAVKKEDNLPPWWSFNPVIFACAKGWETYLAEVKNALTSNVTGQAECEAKAKELTADKAEAKDKVVAIRNFVATNVRNAGPGLADLPLSSLTAADKVLADGYGNSADRAAVMYAMLASQGFKPEFVLASVLPLVESLQKPFVEYPNANDFETVLVKVEIGGESIYLGDTNQYAALGSTPHDGRIGVALDTGKFETISATAATVDRDRTDYDVTLTETGAAKITRTRLYYGNAFSANKKMFAELPPEDLRRWHLEAIAEISQSAVADGELQTDFSSYPGKVSYSVRSDTFAVRDGDYMYLTIPETLRNALWLRGDERTNPLYRSNREDLSITTRINIPESFSVVLPSTDKDNKGAYRWECPDNGGEITLSSKTEKAENGYSKIIIEHKAKLNPAVVAPANYSILKEGNRKLNHLSTRTVLLKK